jgi:DNA-binding transcriptional regulator YiaG
MNCTECNTKMVMKKDNIDYPIAGITLHIIGIPTPVCKKCGYKEIAIPAIKNLHMLVARLIINEIPDPTGEQIKFLRKYMGMSQELFYSYIAGEKSCAETVSRWENNQQKPANAVILLIKKMVEDYIAMQLKEYEQLVESIERQEKQESQESDTEFNVESNNIIDFLKRMNESRKNSLLFNDIKVKYTGKAYVPLRA